MPAVGIKLFKDFVLIPEEFAEEGVADYDRLLAYLPLHGSVITLHNYLEDIGKQNFYAWSGGGNYWTNITQDGTFLGNPIYRVEKQTLADGYFYAYNVSGLEQIQDIEEYTLTGVFKSSNSSESLEPIDYPYQGGGYPWTEGNYTSQYESQVYKYYLGNGWWRYIYTFKIDRTKITNTAYRNNFYFGFKWWTWANTGQYVWGTQPQLYVGIGKKIYQGISTAFNYDNLRLFNDSISFEGAVTNQISTSNMQSYDIGYTGNVCGFSNNFEERFGSGNWSTEIIYDGTIPVTGLTKAQRIQTYKYTTLNKDNNFGYLYKVCGTQTIENDKIKLTASQNTHQLVVLKSIPSNSYGYIEAYVTIPSDGNAGFVYMTTQFDDVNDTYGYYVGVGNGTLVMGKGSNTADSGSWTQLASASTSYTQGQTVKLKVVYSNGSHEQYINDTLVASHTDATYSSGGVGLRVFGGSGGATQYFDNITYSTNKNGWGGWFSGNIGNTSGNIVYGVLLRLHYGEIQFGDLNSSNRLYINESYYQQHGKKLGEWIWQVGKFNGSGGGRHLYQVGNTKADIQAVQIYNTDQLLSYVDGSAGVSYLELPVDIFNNFKDEFTVSFIYEPLSDNTYGSYPQIFTLNWQTSGHTKDWFGIYRGNGWSSQNTILFNVIDSTRDYSYESSVNGINDRIGHKLFILASISTKTKKISAYIRDLTTHEDLMVYSQDLPSDFNFDKGFDYQRLGFLNQGTDQQNQKISELHVYSKFIDASEAPKYIPRTFSIDNKGWQKINIAKERDNLLDRYGESQFITGQFGGIWNKYEQTNCKVMLVPRPFRHLPYSYMVKRQPNVLNSPNWNWGGLRLIFPDDKIWEEGQTYRLSFYYKGYSQHTIEIYFQYSVGWVSNGVGLSGLFLPYITHTFDDIDGWQYYEQIFTIPKGYMYQTGTDGVTYYCMREFKIGYTYTDTDEYGTRLYINDLQIEKVSDSNVSPFRIFPLGVHTRMFKEDSKFTKIYLVGTQFDSTYPENRTSGNRILKINDTEIYNTGGRGLRLTIFDNSFNVLSDTTYDVYADNAQRTNLATQLAGIERTQYWQLTSYDAVNTNTDLTNQLQAMGSKIWPLSYRSPYQAFGRGQQILYEDGAPYNIEYKGKQVINLWI